MNKEHHIAIIDKEEHKRHKDQNILLSLFRTISSKAEKSEELNLKYDDVFPTSQEAMKTVNGITKTMSSKIKSGWYFKFTDAAGKKVFIAKSGKDTRLQLQDYKISLTDSSPVGRTYAMVQLTFIAKRFEDIISTRMYEIFEGKKSEFVIFNFINKEDIGQSFRDISEKYEDCSTINLNLAYSKHIINYFTPGMEDNPYPGRGGVEVVIDFTTQLDSYYSDQETARFMPGTILSKEMRSPDKTKRLESSPFHFQAILDDLDRDKKLKRINLYSQEITAVDNFQIKKRDAAGDRKEKKNLRFYMASPTEDDDTHFVEYYYLKDIIHYLNKYWKDFFNHSETSDSVHNMKSYLGKFNLPAGLKIGTEYLEHHEYFKIDLMGFSESSLPRFEFVMREDIMELSSLGISSEPVEYSRYPNITPIKKCDIAHFPISKDFIKAKLIEIDNKKKDEEGISAQRFYKILEQLLTQALKSYSSEQREISKFLGILDLYPPTDARVYHSIIGIDKEIHKDEPIKKRRRRFLFGENSLKTKKGKRTARRAITSIRTNPDVKNILYFYNSPSSGEPYEFNFRMGNETSTIVESAKYSPIDDAQLRTIAIVNTQKGKAGLGLTGPLKYTGTTYSLELTTKAIGFIFPGNIIKVSRDTIYNGRSREAEGFTKLLTEEMLVVNVEHYKSGPNEGNPHLTKIKTVPLFKYGDEN